MSSEQQSSADRIAEIVRIEWSRVVATLVADLAERADWEQIELLYRRLTEIDGSAVVRLNHAVAVAMTAGSAAALALLGDPDLADELAGYPHYHAAQGRLLAEQGHTADAIDAYRCALRISASATEQRFLQRRISALG